MTIVVVFKIKFTIYDSTKFIFEQVTSSKY